MTDEAFEALVGKLEKQARRNPGRYEMRVLLTALLGYAYLGTMAALGIPLDLDKSMILSLALGIESEAA